MEHFRFTIDFANLVALILWLVREEEEDSDVTSDSTSGLRSSNLRHRSLVNVEVSLILLANLRSKIFFPKLTVAQCSKTPGVS